MSQYPTGCVAKKNIPLGDVIIKKGTILDSCFKRPDGTYVLWHHTGRWHIDKCYIK